MLQQKANFVCIWLSLIVLYVLAVFSVEPILSEPDAAWHLAAGDYIRANGLPKTDPWSFTSQGAPWYNLSYGFDVFISFIHSVFGAVGLYVFILFVVVLLCGICAYHCRERNISGLSTAVTIFFAGLALIPSLYLRPQLTTYVLIAIIHLELYRDSKTTLRRSWVTFPVLTWVWSNMHGGVIAVFLTAGCYLLQSLFHKDYKRFRRYLGLGAVSFTTVFLTPYGLSIFQAMSVSIVSVMNANIVEWKYLVPFLIWEQGFFLLFFIVLGNLRGKETPFADKLAILFWLVCAFRSRRHFPIFVILSIPFMAKSLDEFIQNKGILKKIHGDISGEVNKKMSLYMVIGSTLVFIGSLFYLCHADQYAYWRQSRAMTHAVEYIARKYPDARVFNRFNDGGPLILLAKERFKISIDGRIDTAYPAEYMSEYASKIDSVEDGWMDVVQKYEPDIFLLPNGSKMEKALHEFEGEWVWEKTFEEGKGRYSDIKYFVIVKKSLFDRKQ